MNEFANLHGDVVPERALGQWLHNFGMSPRTTVVVRPKRKGRSCGRGIRMVLSGGDQSPAGLLKQLRRDGWTRARDTAGLESELDLLADDMPVPRACVVTSDALDNDRVCQCPLVVAAVLAKTGEHVFLADRPASLVGAPSDVVLILPDARSLKEFEKFVAGCEAGRARPRS